MLNNSQNFKMNLLGLVVSLLLTACGSDSSTTSKVLGSEADLAAYQVAKNTIVPAVNGFQAQAQLLDTQAELFCSTANTTQANLLSLQLQWKETAKAWYQLLPFKFGPVEGGLDINLVEPVYAYIDYFRFNKGSDLTSSVRTQMKEWVDGPTPSSITDAFIAGKSASLVGFLPLEVTIFETTDTQSSVITDVLTEFSTASRKCQLLNALTNQLLVQANIIQSSWQSNYANTGKSYLDLLVNNELENAEVNDDGKSAISKVTVSVQDYFDYLKNRDVTQSTGQISNSIWQSVDASVESVEQVLAGTESTTLSLYQIMMNNGNDTDIAVIKQNITTLKATIAEQNSIDFKAAAGVLDGNFKREIPDAIGVSLGLNFSDGD
jgi:predicted lipoprotein